MSDPPHVTYSYHAQTDVGRQREKNEDSHAEYPLPDGGVLLIVADGMGGHGHGDVASQIAVRVIGEVFQTTSGTDPRDRLHSGFLTANRQIIAEAERIGGAGMGTTCVAAYVRGAEAWVAHIGDSRIYHVRDGLVLWRTTDHTRVQKMVEMGLLAASAAKDHPDANVVTRALGYAQLADGTIIEPDVKMEPLVLHPGDSLVLCSDGLYDDIEDHEISSALPGQTPEDAARMLVDTANSRGGHDNITCTVLTFASQVAGYSAATRPTTLQASVAPMEPLAMGPAPAKRKKVSALLLLLLIAAVVAAAAIVIFLVTNGG
jgi:serine/threonine protein phosphatase PrpC